MLQVFEPLLLFLAVVQVTDQDPQVYLMMKLKELTKPKILTMSQKCPEDHHPNKKAEGRRNGVRFGIILAGKAREKIS